MSNWSPTVEGFRTIFRRPALSFAEISWRWSFGAAVWLLALFAAFEYLDTLPVTNRDLLLLRSGTPSFIARALSHIVRGSGLRFVLAALAITAASAILWIVLASLGRAATLGPLLESIRSRAGALPGDTTTDPAGADRQHPVAALAGLHFLRVTVWLLAAFALLGALFGAHLLSPAHDPRPGLSALVFICLALVIFPVTCALHWLLGLATLFVVRDREDPFGAISAAVGLCRDRLGAVSAVGTWFGLAHVTFFVIATSVVGFPLSLLHIVPPGFVLLGVVLVTLLYFAVADSLYIGRLAGYAAILEAPALPTPVLTSPDAYVPYPPFFPAASISAIASPEGQIGEAAEAMVDQSELILSDTTDPSRPPSSAEQAPSQPHDSPSSES